VPNEKGKAYTPDGVGSNMTPAKRKAGLVNLNTHDLRGTFATKLYAAGWSDSQVAEAVGWSEKKIKRIKARYVNAQNVVRLAEARTANENNR
jgi:integrase